MTATHAATERLHIKQEITGVMHRPNIRPDLCPDTERRNNKQRIMKKILTHLVLLGALAALSGCLHEKYDECPMEEQFNVTLAFTLPDGNGGDRFRQNISSMDMNIYDGEGAVVMAKRLVTVDWTDFAGVKLLLPAGDYQVVAWANAGDNVRLEGAETSSPYYTYCNFVDGKCGSADKLYYAPKNGGRNRAVELPGTYSMVVDPLTGHAGTLELTPAHRTLKIYIDGYNGTPRVDLEDVPEGLAWFGMAQLTGGDDTPRTIPASKPTTPLEKQNVWYDYVEFDTFYFDQTNDIVIRIVDAGTGQVVYSIPLNEAIEEVAGEVSEYTISLIFRFRPGGVEVALPDWSREETDPGLGL